MESKKRTWSSEIAVREASDMLPYHSLESTSRLGSGNNSPPESNWRHSMERRMERMERTMNRAANIMDSYFGNLSPETKYMSSEKVFDQLKYSPKPCLTSGPCRVPALPPLDYSCNSAQQMCSSSVQGDANIPRIECDYLEDGPTTPASVPNQPPFFTPRGCRCVATSAHLPPRIEECDSGRRASISLVPDPVATSVSETYVTDLNPSTTIILLTPNGGRTTVKINVNKE